MATDVAKLTWRRQNVLKFVGQKIVSGDLNQEIAQLLQQDPNFEVTIVIDGRAKVSGIFTVPCCVCSGINPRVKSGRFMKILPDYEHMEYRDVYTCRMYLPLTNGFCAVNAWSVLA